MINLKKVIPLTPEPVYKKRRLEKARLDPYLLLRHEINILLKEQEEKDPPHYVPHGKGHSERVYVYAKQIVKALPINIKKAQLDHLNSCEKTLDFMIYLICILHDIGYPKQMEKGFQKCNHCPEGAHLFNQKVAPLLKKCLLTEGTPNHTIEKICKIISDSILYHGADKKEGLFSFQLNSELGNFVAKKIPLALPSMFGSVYVHRLPLTCEGRYIDLFSHKDNKLGIKYFDTDFSDPETFFHALIRLADNMDSTRQRLHTHQLSVSDKIFQKLSKNKPTPYQLEHIGLPQIRFDSEKEKEFYLLLKKDPSQRKYFFGISLLTELSIHYDKNLASFICEYTLGKYTSVSKYILVEHEFLKGETIPLRDFFITRLKESFKSIRFSGKEISFRFKKSPLEAVNV
ncbi:hypothetical protein DID77_02715 [Candidatus Marinamargulisbacteria bacterium SCGC AG-439-L15]|nr:hypothetical protein DID77_02715 [Candidatus Marinamargulisbacteria bacterium SCGC AG-439-L15]